MITNQFLLATTLLLSLTNVTVFSQEDKPQKHYIGVNAGLDPFNLAKISIESALNSNTENEPNQSYDEENFVIVTLGGYYKYKPFNKLDFDAGYKLCMSSLGDLNRSDNSFNYKYYSIADHLLYTRINYNLGNIHQEGVGHISTSFEMGCLLTPGRLTHIAGFSPKNTKNRLITH